MRINGKHIKPYENRYYLLFVEHFKKNKYVFVSDF